MLLCLSSMEWYYSAIDYNYVVAHKMMISITIGETPWSAILSSNDVICVNAMYISLKLSGRWSTYPLECFCKIICIVNILRRKDFHRHLMYDHSASMENFYNTFCVVIIRRRNLSLAYLNNSVVADGWNGSFMKILKRSGFSSELCVKLRLTIYHEPQMTIVVPPWHLLVRTPTGTDL